MDATTIITIRDMDDGTTFVATLGELLAENDFGDDEIAEITDALTSGRSAVIGGGAAPAFEIARVAEAVS